MNAEGLADWSDAISATLDAAHAGHAGFLNDRPRRQFFNPLRTPIGPDPVERSIDWIAFPRQVQIRPGSQRDHRAAADAERSRQDEYCEWSVARRADGAITRVEFTSEPASYWEFLAKRNPARVVALYQEHVNPAVKEADLFAGGRYDPFNRWNSGTSGGAMHLIQQDNTLGAEIELAAASTIVRRIGGRVLKTAAELIACSRYGEGNRNSDPHIGSEVNAIARAGAEITLANPIGLYIDRLDTAGWKTPDGTDALEFWRLTRGAEGHTVRAVFEVPAAKGYTVGDVEINGARIEFGSQIAEHLFIRLTGVGCRFDPARVQPFEDCRRIAASGLPGIAPDAPAGAVESFPLKVR